MTTLGFPVPPSLAFCTLIDALECSAQWRDLREVVLAQCAIESGWGHSELAKLFNNFGGMKWRPFMHPFARPQWYAAHDGATNYCAFKSADHFVQGYWYRLNTHKSYVGWQDHADTPEHFMQFIGPIWVGLDKERNTDYVRKVIRVWNEHTRGLID